MHPAEAHPAEGSGRASMAALTGRDRLSVLAGLAGVVVLSWA